MEKDFYLCLPSNSSLNNFPQNNAGHFFTSLPRSINVEGEFEIGLSEIIFSNSYYNINDKEIGFKFSYKDYSSDYIYLEHGLYKTPIHFIDCLNNLLRIHREKDGKNVGVKFFFNQASKKVTLRILRTGLKFQMTQGLVDVIGLNEKEFEGPVKTGGLRAIDINRDFSLIYVYCDLIEHRLVGDTLAPLLRILPTADQTSDVIHCIFQKPHYIPLAKRNFNFIEILLATDTGKKLQFQSDKTVVTLHLRPRRNYH